ncbi:MAG TPA: hypothetical protein VLT61_12185 [Anaeromyxobacteraceae bacterium]|nr:hypothetical protein [Anaeromyxobacteraceae bacterium]
MSAPAPAFDIYSRFAGDLSGKAQLALRGWMAGWRAKPILAPPNMWWKGRVLEYPSAKVEMNVPLPVHSPRVRPYLGSAEFDGMSGVVMSVKRYPRQIGTSASVLEVAEFDFKGWSLAPESMAIAIGNIPGNDAADLLGGNASGGPQGTGVLSARASTSWWNGITGAYFACLSGDATKIPVNPFDRKVLNKATGLSTWFNAHENFDITAANIQTMLKNMQVRPGFDGLPLDYGRQNIELWCPSSRYEDARVLTEVMETLAGSGIANTIEYTLTGGSNAGQNIVIQGQQTNFAFGRAKVIPVPQMRSDMWCLVNPTTIPGSEIFLRALGGPTGTYETNSLEGAMEDAQNNDRVPHIMTVVHGEQSPMFYEKQKIGIWNLINEGMALASPYAIEFAYTGSAS